MNQEKTSHWTKLFFKIGEENDRNFVKKQKKTKTKTKKKQKKQAKIHPPNHA